MAERGRRINPSRVAGASCSHEATTSTVTAGIRRTVCDTCAMVSVEYVEETVRIFPDRSDVEIDLTASQPQLQRRAPRRCHNCGARAVFMTPEGLACPTHAWEAASAQEAMGEDVWIPIRIEQTARRPDRAR